MTDTSGDFESRREPSPSYPYTLEVLESDPSSDGYTFVPRNADADECLTEWITASREGLVDLSAWR